MSLPGTWPLAPRLASSRFPTICGNAIRRSAGNRVSEADEITRRYARRRDRVDELRQKYDLLSPATSMLLHERQMSWIRWIKHARLEPLEDKRLIEIGCGAGGNLLRLMLLGFRPENLVGNDLLPENVAYARNRLPAAIRLVPGEASRLDVASESFDVVFQALVFSSILDDELQRRLARRMWDWARPGGGVLWYDFVYSNPANVDVRGMPLGRVRALFPDATITSWRVTLAPPIARRVTRLHPSLYSLCNTVPWLRTHLLCWLAK
jgi:SAM-dependent methyltransferase